MPVSSSFRTFVVDQLSRVVPHLRARAMFGGVGIYAGDLFFALIADDSLYFKVNDSNRPDFERLAMNRSSPTGRAGKSCNITRCLPISWRIRRRSSPGQRGDRGGG